MTEQAPAPIEGLESLASLERNGVITRTSLTLPPNIPYEQYEALFSMLIDTRDSMCWLLGDLINYGEKIYGETYAQAVKVTGLAEQTLTNYASVCARIPRSRRRPPARIPFSVHAEVAYMPPADQEHWLREAEKHGWRRSQLREALAPYRAEKGTAKAPREITIGEGDKAIEILPPAVESSHVCQCPACGRYHRSDEDVVAP